MVKNNKVINKVLLPKFLWFGLLLAFSSSAGFYITLGNAQQNGRIAKSDTLLLLIIASLAVLSCMYVYSDYKKTEKVSMSIAHKYLKQELANNPDFKPFENVLDNPQALQNLSALVFNSLRPSEREQVAQILVDTYGNLKNNEEYDSNNSGNTKDNKELFVEARDKILPIIKGHAAVHPEFMNNIYSAMASANNTIYIMSKQSIQQNVK